MESTTRAVRLAWAGQGLQFEGAGTIPETPRVVIDGDNESAPGPMLNLLLAAAACMGSDVVTILQKMRLGLRQLTIDVTGRRAETEPSRYLDIRFAFRIEAEDPDEAKARRAIELSLQKYYSVVHSLAKDIGIDYELEIS
jgi:putative redox protein